MSCEAYVYLFILIYYFSGRTTSSHQEQVPHDLKRKLTFDVLQQATRHFEALA